MAPGLATLHAFDALLPVQNYQELRLVNHHPTVAELKEDHAISLVLRYDDLTDARRPPLHHCSTGKDHRRRPRILRATAGGIVDGPLAPHDD